jgi:hypothetical protein
MKLMKRKKIYIPLFILAAVMILIFILLFNNFIISTRIYYNVAYQGDIQELERLIDRMSYSIMKNIVNIAVILER